MNPKKETVGNGREPVFGYLKHNKERGRFMLRGKNKVEIETGLLAFAHNLANM